MARQPKQQPKRQVTDDLPFIPTQLVLFELIDGEVVPFFADDPKQTAHPDDGRLKIDP